HDPMHGTYGFLVHNGKHIFTYGAGPQNKGHMLLLIDPKDGKVAAAVPHNDALNHATPFVLGDHFMLQPDCVHSNNYMHIISGDPATFAKISEWRPQHHNTNTYGGAVVGFIHPIADGRLWFRCADGVYCYDLRTSKTQ
ncbi:MAG: hypothetical protein H7210_00585, partial [Pyrinomonadaceae bacterium]|nr:hypothetical protein [Phycisphaerales bacterium]